MIVANSGEKNDLPRVRASKRVLQPTMNQVVSPQLLLCVAFMAAGLAGCDFQPTVMDKTASASSFGNHPPSIRSAKILPSPVTLEGTVSVLVDAEDLDRDPLTFRYKWFVNDAPMPVQTFAALKTDGLKRGDHIRVEIVPSDGKIEGPTYKVPVETVANTPPVVTGTSFISTVGSAGQHVEIRVEGSDRDGDEIHYAFRWWRNSTLLKEGEGNTVDIAEWAAQDVLAVDVTPSDPFTKGSPFRTERAGGGNRPPAIVTQAPALTSLERYEYTVRANDPDGDVLSFTLATGIPGMSIEKDSGQLVWIIAPGTKGNQRAKILVEDGHGGSASQEIDLALPALTPS